MERKLCELLDHEVGAVEADRRRHSIGTATVKIPAAFAAFTPFGESSKAIASGRATTHKPARGDLTAIDQRPNRYGRWSKWGGTGPVPRTWDPSQLPQSLKGHALCGSSPSTNLRMMRAAL